MKQIIINSKTHGQFMVKIDDEDFELVSKIKCVVSKCGKSFYVKKAAYPRIYLHRFLLGLNDSKILCDHKDRDTMNNQRNNIRIAERSQNNSNRTGRGFSKYLGVFFRNEPYKNYTKLWCSKIVKDKKVRCLGNFITQEDAALAYNKAAMELHGEFANLNNIEEATNLHSDGD